MGDEQQGPVRWWKQKGYPVTGLDGFSSCYGRWCYPAYAHPFRLKMGLEGWPLKNFLFSQRMQYSHGSPQLSIVLVPRDPKPPSNFQGHQTRAWAKCSHTFKKKSTTSHKLAPTSFTSQTIYKGRRLLALLETPRNPQSYNWPHHFLEADDLSQVYKPTFQPAQMPFYTYLPKALTTCCQ